MTTKPTDLDTQELREQIEDIFFDGYDGYLHEKIDKLLPLIAQREQAAELRGKMNQTKDLLEGYRQSKAFIHSPDVERTLEHELTQLQATKPENSERNAHYNVYKLGKEYREATKPEKGTEE